ncbi:hypothetical protein PQR65_05265 [Paraburkholderia nemoris]|uniref:hypothetical protein n=1 Tax=Paraburkholderia nemoris TaxID=2793076 RepID=UPI0038BB2774
MGDPLATWNSSDAAEQSEVGHSTGVMRVAQRCGERLSDEKGFVFGGPFGKPFAGGNATAVDDGAVTDSDASA